ncbi:hypothetical protein GGI25_001612 [Coemansia spiralis]|uniref:Rab-GAP TBC domain-containing protein n=2 Tax=Coemansia TaxID=4863 RepID=A0A9W8GAK4_9FUNG|nr:hypothetical protein EDC05_003362 [Coemansia umbellata]KAJ2623957.1 hypothetical protein GGI26_001972 [Coemansia sp. RSA 1358]KAJ2679256.1 hypothetical protein GGI25_001612 [Coemansia spiralis]
MSPHRIALFDRVLFSAPDASIDIHSLATLCYHGIPDVPGLRALCWQLLLGHLPPDRRTWPQAVAGSRRSYMDLVYDIVRCSNTADNADSSQTLLAQIRADIQRTMPDIAAFRNKIDGLSDHNDDCNNEPDNDKHGNDDDDARCNTIVSDRTALSMDSADSCSTLAPTPRQQPPSLLPPPASRAPASTRYEDHDSRSANSIARLRRALADKTSAAASLTFDSHIHCSAAHGATKDASSSWLLRRPQTHADALARILFVHAHFNKGVGYVQGMNELLAPLYYVLARSTDRMPAHSSFQCQQQSCSTCSLFVDCEADAFHMFILALRGVHLDMFISAMDTGTSTSCGSPRPRQGSVLQQYNVDDAQNNKQQVTEQQLLAHHQLALNTVMARSTIRAGPCAIPSPLGESDSSSSSNSSGGNSGTAFESGQSIHARHDSLIPDVAANTKGEIGGLQDIIRHWWTNYVRVADAQLWTRLEALGIHPEHFAVRWVLVWGAREFALPDVLVLWDALMADRARLNAQATQTQPEAAVGSNCSADVANRTELGSAIVNALAIPSSNNIESQGEWQKQQQQQHKIFDKSFKAVRSPIGKLQCEVRMAQGISGDDDDCSQLGFLLDFFTAVLLAMRNWLMAAPFEKCISLLQCLPRDSPELGIHSLIKSAFRLRAERANRRAVRACKAILSTIDRTKYRMAAGIVEAGGLEPLYALYELAAPISMQTINTTSHQLAYAHKTTAQTHQHSDNTTTAAGSGGGGKVSRFFGKLGLNVQTLLSGDGSNSNSSDISAHSAGNGMSQFSDNTHPDCLLLAITGRFSSGAAPAVMRYSSNSHKANDRTRVYEVVHYNRHTRIATAICLGECDALRPSLASVRVSVDSANETKIAVRLPAPCAFASQSLSAESIAAKQTAARGRMDYSIQASLAPSLHSSPNLRYGLHGAPPVSAIPMSAARTAAFDDEVDSSDDDDNMLLADRRPIVAAAAEETGWWNNMHKRQHPMFSRLAPRQIELYDYDDSDDE